MTLDQAFQLAMQHHQAGRLPEAEGLYRQILGQQTNHAGALHLLGLLAHQVGRPEIAIDLITRAIQIEPNIPDSRINLGSVLLAQRKFEPAIEQFQIALQLNPKSAEAYYNLGNVYTQLDRLDLAVENFRKSVQMREDYAWGWNNLGSALQERGLHDDAIDAFQRAVQIDPNLAEAHSGIGNIARGQGEVPTAIEHFRRAAELRPENPGYLSNVLLSMLLHPNYDRETIWQQHVLWRQRYADPLKHLIRPHNNDRDPDRRLKIGYACAEFRKHVVGQYFLPLLLNHDHKEFEIILYSDVSAPDEMTRQMQSSADGWRDTIELNDAQLAELIRKDQIDILVDLMFHLKGNRMRVFAQKPAPVQAAWLSYPSTSGLETIDYRITDAHLDPPGLNDAFYSEKSAYLPDSYWVYDPPAENEASAMTPLPALAAGHVTFACLNNFCKVNDLTISLWARVLNAVPSSRMLILIDKGQQRQRTLDKLSKLGVDPSRIELVDRLPFKKYLELYHRIDLVLDTSPYNGHTTSLDAIWMGVPVVTLLGQTAVSRGGLCLASNVGLTELVAQTQDDYVRIAVELASDLPRLSELRGSLRDRMRQSPLLDAPRFARNMELLYRQMWRTWCEAGL